MSEFFINLLDRHLGTSNVVEPRGRSRFEIEGAGSAILLPIDHSGPDETGDENQEHQDSVVRIPENHLAQPPANSIEPQRIDTEVKLPDHHTGAVEAVGDNLARMKNVIRSTARNSISADVNAPELELHRGTSALRQQERQSVKPKPVEQTGPKEENALRRAIHRHSTVETENRRTLPGDLPKHISDTNPTEAADAHTSEFDYRFEGEFDNRIRTMIARLKDHQKARSTEHAETNSLDRSVVTRMENAGDTEKEPAAQPRPAAPLFDESGKVGASDSGQERQYAFVPENRDGSLEPPVWFFDMQAEFNRRWNELNRKSQAEPVINVTISRIEIKATKLRKPEQPRLQKKPSGVMSLDRYLSQSGRGGRG